MAGNKKVRKKYRKEDLNRRVGLVLDLLDALVIECDEAHNPFKKIKKLEEISAVIKNNIKKISTSEPGQIERFYNSANHLIFTALQEIFNKLATIQKNKKSATAILRTKKIEDELIKQISLLIRLNPEKTETAINRGRAGIISVKFYNAQNKETKIFKTGEPFIAKIKYHAKEKIEKPQFGIAIHREDGIYICGPNTKTSEKTIRSIKGKGTVTFKIESLPLLQGKYLFTATLLDYEGKQFYDYHWKECPFLVLQGNIKDKYGLLYSSHTWEYSEN